MVNPIDEHRKFETDPLLAGRTETEIATAPLKGRVWSCGGEAFMATSPDTDTVIIDPDEGFALAQGDGIAFSCPVYLPNGAIVTNVIVYGSIADETWTLRRNPIDDVNPQTLAAANINTEDTSISNATIDNQNYRYMIGTSSLDTNDTIYGVRIIYTY
ncbi:MAG TPA: hypothetical protein ENI22_01500 [Candidatus Pacearchaeota archaeon]|nr:hypothetical protein [Candidatus Pacearchaeota archaeon]